MRVYRVTIDVEQYQWLIPEEESLWASGVLTFDCRRKAADWPRPAVYVQNPKLEAGDFFNFAPGALVAGPSAFAAVGSVLERAGELLPLVGTEGEYLALNVLECVNCLDQGATEFRRSPRTGERIGIVRYEFHADRLDESSIFKIPETSRGEVLVYEGLKDPEDEFKHLVEAAGLKGLVFELIWESI